MRAAWNDLANQDANVAYRAVVLLAGAPALSLPLLRDNLKPPPLPDVNHIEDLLSKLDSPQFAAREQAKRELEGFDADIERALERYLTRKVSLAGS